MAGDVSNKQNILVHVCCAPCAVYSFENLVNEGFNITGYFYNPNIHPESEYKKRFEELVRLSEIKNYSLIEEKEPSENWFQAVKGFDQEQEGGKRCELCFQMRLEKTALYAGQNDFDGFTTVLTISPHKNSSVVNRIGRFIAEKYKIKFLEKNFKKQDGFKKSLKLSQDYGFYRQNYCGCSFSMPHNKIRSEIF